MRRSTIIGWACLESVTTNQEADGTAEAARAAAEGLGRVQGLWGEREIDSVKAEGDGREKRDGRDVCECAVIGAAGTVRAGYSFYSRTGPR